MRTQILQTLTREAEGEIVPAGGAVDMPVSVLVHLRAGVPRELLPELRVLARKGGKVLGRLRALHVGAFLGHQLPEFGPLQHL